ncbi:MAG TPA: ATP-binding cassette domain-containing protein, partial [Agromyces sp.]|nr:ATP-binding cassette domain-containing protein [Agromyces sp.]
MSSPSSASKAAPAADEPTPAPAADTAGGTGVASEAVVVRGVERIFTGAKGATVTALTGIDLTVHDGEFVSLIGPSGCGKSTLLRLIADLDEPTAGDIRVFGRTAKQARIDQAYGIAFQQAGLLPWRSVAANIELPLQLHGIGAA